MKHVAETGVHIPVAAWVSRARKLADDKRDMVAERLGRWSSRVVHTSDMASHAVAESEEQLREGAVELEAIPPPVVAMRRADANGSTPTSSPTWSQNDS